MPTASVALEVPGAAESIWDWVADPARLPRWWPAVDRVDRPSSDVYTRWVRSPRGNAVAMTFRLSELEPGRRAVWTQQLEGTAFERSIRSAEETIEIVPEADSTVVRLTLRRRLRGTARLGSAFIGRGQRRELEMARAALEDRFGA